MTSPTSATELARELRRELTGEATGVDVQVVKSDLRVIADHCGFDNETRRELWRGFLADPTRVAQQAAEWATDILGPARGINERIRASLEAGRKAE